MQADINRAADSSSRQFRQGAKSEITSEIERRIRLAHSRDGLFPCVHVAPKTSGDVPDDPRARLAVLRSATPHIASDGAMETRLGELGYRFFTSRKRLVWYLEELLGRDIDGDSILGKPLGA